MGVFLLTLGTVLIAVLIWFFSAITPRERWAAVSLFLAIGSTAFVLHAVVWYWGWWSTILIPLGIAQAIAYHKTFSKPQRHVRYWGRA